MWISAEECKNIMKKYNVLDLPEILISDFLYHSPYILRFDKGTKKVEWIKRGNCSL